MKDTLWNGFGISAEVWFSLILIAVLAIVGWVNAIRRDVAFTLVICGRWLGLPSSTGQCGL